MDPSRWSRDIPLASNLALTSPISGGRSVGIVRSRTRAMEFSFFYNVKIEIYPRYIFQPFLAILRWPFACWNCYTALVPKLSIPVNNSLRCTCLGSSYLLARPSSCGVSVLCFVCVALISIVVVLFLLFLSAPLAWMFLRSGSSRVHVDYYFYYYYY
jgi:hypothetical protein